MIKKIIAMVIMVLAFLASGAPAFATGQPNKSCGDPGAEQSPPGFNTGGFANAELNYAGSDNTPSKLNSQSGNAIAQYDVACYHFTQNHQ